MKTDAGMQKHIDALDRSLDFDPPSLSTAVAWRQYLALKSIAESLAKLANPLYEISPETVIDSDGSPSDVLLWKNTITNEYRSAPRNWKSPRPNDWIAIKKIDTLL